MFLNTLKTTVLMKTSWTIPSILWQFSSKPGQTFMPTPSHKFCTNFSITKTLRQDDHLSHEFEENKIVIFRLRDESDDENACLCSSIAQVLDRLLQFHVKSFWKTYI